MAAGRPRKPTVLHEIERTKRKDRHGDGSDEPTPPQGPIEPPSWLEERGRRRVAYKLFKQIAPVLEQMRVMSTADVHALAMLCDAYEEYIACRDIVAEKGRTYTSVVTVVDDDGEEYDKTIIKPRPEVAMAADAWRRVKAMLAEFGLTPASRARAKVVDPKGRETDPFAEFLTKRGGKTA